MTRFMREITLILLSELGANNHAFVFNSSKTFSMKSSLYKLKHSTNSSILSVRSGGGDIPQKSPINMSHVK